MKSEHVKDFLLFGWKQALCCIFPVVIFLTLAVSKVLTLPFLHRYDFILLVCILAQIVLVWMKLESVDELKVITVFHIIGLGLELYKVHMGSWSYPEEGWTKIGGVPLYSGFMYASVSSYVCQAWKRFDLHLIHWPRTSFAIILSVSIYTNFFTHHFAYDIRWVLIALIVILFYKSHIRFTVITKTYRMHTILSFMLVAFFIWLAENISTFLGAWRYPDQEISWRIVHWGKISSWFMLVIITIIIVAELKRIKYPEQVKGTK
ncbi:DUF817 domain-containing protein [Paenibacillus qinlingensis]|uniref:Uncharacterized membrane protein YoaT (DUF817 family) n=1 Tax=Paenibacillus qinlingensis TaxID=1837343 RepID=A0ABU1NRR4_9BACL|nr:DUF817 domain-containing protein [Paenibacillus qinlingensis]MDR6549722.1 uncharacterized membrane protein YoaT (DUF817 family) [Paenibacillus qinlingensis]